MFVCVTHQFFEFSLSVAELLIHAQAHLGALQGGDDLQLGIFVFDDIVLQHQTQDLDTHVQAHTVNGQSTDVLGGVCGVIVSSGLSWIMLQKL